MPHAPPLAAHPVTPDLPGAGPGDVPSPAAAAAQAMAAYEHLIAQSASYRPRAGQRDMAQHIADTLSQAQFSVAMPVPGEAVSGPPQRAIAVVQAGTGVGKSAAYIATAVALAQAFQKRVLISTATVSLQEQLMAKDLPALSQSLLQPFGFALAKGRGRYVCRLKLENHAQAEDDPGLFEAEAVASDEPRSWGQRAANYADWLQQLNCGQWDGDRDRLEDPPEGAFWSAVAAERHSCTARHCPSYSNCSYYHARASLAQAQVIVVNHDLLLSTLGKHALPDPSDCYLVLDEAHHLGDVAQNQFTASMDLLNTQWLDRLPRAVESVARELGETPAHDVAGLARELKAALAELARLGMARINAGPEGQWLNRQVAQAGPASGPLGAASRPGPSVNERLSEGRLPPEWVDVVAQLNACALPLLRVFEQFATQLKTLARDNPADAPRCAQLYTQLGPYAPRLEHVQDTSSLWLQSPEQGLAPLAKWLQAGVQRGMVTLSAHACALQPGRLLQQQLWRRVRAAVLTSASLTSCGRFDHFLSETGLFNDPAVAALEVQSPFDHAAQGRLVVVQSRNDPKDVAAYTEEMLDALLQDLRQVERGALVLFTSKAQLAQAQARAQEERGLAERIQVQGEASRGLLLRRHGERVAQGKPAILFGLQSFGEGLDLPGELCEWVFITKLPFASPSDPVGQARADWLRSQGRDPFAELVVPATAQRLLQWTGRALRSESDRAVVVCYDPRLLRQAYGRRMLQGLPPYRLQQRRDGVETDC